MSDQTETAVEVHDRIVTWVGGMKYPEDRDALESHAASYLEDYEDAIKGEMPSRMSATPVEIDAYLRSILAEDVYQRYLWAVGDAAAH